MIRSRHSVAPRSVPAFVAALAALAAFTLATPQQAAAQADYFYPAPWDSDTAFDPTVPSPWEFLGYEIGQFHTRHDRIAAYMQALAAASDRATYREIGMTHEHRPMPVLTVTSPANHAELEDIRTRHLAASDPAMDAAEGITDGGADLPVIVHLGYGVHGNETSSAEAAMLTAYWLVAATDGEVARYLDEGVYHVEPVLNPDGRDRHTNWANMHRAEPFVSDPLDREHNEVWPGGRTNHYWFDLNRDWLPLVHPESQARIEWHHAWRPNVVTDYHEMGTSSTYFFEPSEAVGSWNPLLPERLYTDITMRFADDWAAALDDIGSLYFTKEVYDNSYPGYGSTYPNFLGGLGLVFEQASSRGHIQDSGHHGVLTFPFAIRNHTRTGLATVRVAVEEKQALREYQREFFETARAEAGTDPVDGWVFGDPIDASLNRAFLDLLLRHRIEVYEADADVTAGGRTFDADHAWVVPADQAQYRLARSVFERTETFPDSVFYDASTWTVSLAYGIPDAEITAGRLPLGARVTAAPAPPTETGVGSASAAGSPIAWLLDWRDSGAPTALQSLLSAGVRAEFSMVPFTAPTPSGPVEMGRGSISIPRQLQTLPADSLAAALEAAARAGGVRFHRATSGYSAEGADLGSRSFRPVRSPRVLLPIGEGMSSYEVGQLWHLLDQRIGMPVTKVDTGDFGRVDWSDYDVLVLASGNLSFLAGDRLDALRSWIRGGGTLVAIRSATAWAASNGLTPRIEAPGFGAPTSEEGDAEDADSSLRLDWADASEREGAQAIGGSIWEADLDLTHPLGFGYTRRFLPVWRDHAIFFAPSENPYSTVAQLTDDPHLSGYVSDENEARLAGSPSVLVDELGGGAVVLLVDNPNFRGYWRGTTRLFLNALFFGREIDVP